MTRLSGFWPVLLALGLVSAGSARAEMVGFSYHWASSPSVVVGTNPSNITGNGISSGSVAFALAPAGSASSLLGGGPTTIPGATLTTTGSAPLDAADSFASPFSMTLHLSDTASGTTGDLTFAGTVNGSLTISTSTLTADFASPLTQQLTLGGHVYSVTIDPAAAGIPPPGAATPGQINALVQVAAPPSPPAAPTPEPPAVLLAGLALALLGLACCRRARPRLALLG